MHSAVFFITGLAAYFMSPYSLVSWILGPILVYGIWYLISEESSKMPAEPSVPRASPHGEKASTDHVPQEGSAEFQIERICQDEVPALLNRLPYGNWHQKSFTMDGDRWRFDFQCKSAS